MLNDWELLNKAKKGCDNSFESLFNKYNRLLLKITLLITGSKDTANDIVQDSFMKLLNTRSIKTEGNFKNYLTTIAYRLALKEIKKRKKYVSLPKEEVFDNTPSPMESHIKMESQLNIFDTIYSLPDNQKEILVLRFYGNYSYEEISEITEVPIGTVKSRLFYAVKACGEKLKDRGLL